MPAFDNSPEGKARAAAAGRAAGTARAARMTPEERASVALKASQAGHAARARRREGQARLRADLTAQWLAAGRTQAEVDELLYLYGIDPSKAAYRPGWARTPEPSLEALDPYFQMIDNDPDTYGALTWEQRRRQAIVLMRADRIAALSEGLEK